MVEGKTGRDDGSAPSGSPSRIHALFCAVHPVLRPGPAPQGAGVPDFGDCHLRHPLVSALHAFREDLAARPGRGRADLDLPAVLARERRIAREHVEIPEGETGGELIGLRVAAAGRGGMVGFERNGRGELEQAKVWGAFFCAEANADELDLGDDEPVSTVVRPHQDLQVRQVPEVFNTCLTLLVPFLQIALTRVPLFVGFDEAHDTTATVAAESSLPVIGKIGDEERPILSGSGGLHDNMTFSALSDPQGSVDFCNVEILNSACKGRQVLRVGTCGRERSWLGKCSSIHVDVEKSVKNFELLDGLQIEILPGPKIADIPPTMPRIAVPIATVVRGNEVESRIWFRKIL